MKWYTLRVATGKERKLQETIEKEVSNHGLDKYFGQALIPKEKIYKIKNGKRIKSEKAYLPGYILIEANLVGELPYIIKKINNVHGFLGEEQNGKPVCLREKEVNRILGKMDDLEQAEDVMDNIYTVGELVRIIDGPFNTFVGSVSKVDESKQRITLNVKVFNRDTPVELKFTQIDREV